MEKIKKSKEIKKGVVYELENGICVEAQTNGIFIGISESPVLSFTVHDSSDGEDLGLRIIQQPFDTFWNRLKIAIRYLFRLK